MTITANWYPDDQHRLLLVDDDTALCQTLASGLAEHGFQVDIAHSLREAMRRTDRSRPRFALVALKLPDGSGLKLVAHLKRMEPTPRIVVLTAYPSVRTAVEAMKLGAVDYLVKPSSIEEVMAAFDRKAGNDNVPIDSKAMTVHLATWEYISHVLHQNNGNISATARTLSIDRRTLQRKLRKRANGAIAA